jgi:hydrogenase maturation protease
VPPAARPARRVVVFACGEPLRGDDAAASRAVAAIPLRSRLAADIRLVTTLAPEDLTGLEDDAAVLIVDAVSGVEPGTVVDIDLDDLPELVAVVSVRSTHQLALDLVVGLARVLGWDGPGAFIGIGGACFDTGSPLSEVVERAMPAVREAIESRIALWAEGTAVPG